MCLSDVEWEGGKQGFKQLSEPWRHGAFRSKQNPFGALYEEVIKCCVQNPVTNHWMDAHW